MNGWLIVNNFVNSEKSKTLRNMLLNSAKEYNINLELKRTGEHELNIPIGEPFKALPDFAIFWDKDIHLAQRLEQQGLRLFNPSRAIELCDNKVLTYMELAAKGIKFPKTICSPKTYEGIGYNNDDFIKNACDTLGFPLIIKEAYGSFGQQVYLADNFDAAKKIISNLNGREFVMQRFVGASRGRDVRVNVVGSEVIASIYRYNDNDFRSNISNGGSMKPYEVNAEQAELAINACKSLGLDFGGIDVLFDDNGAAICEVNSNPHFKSTFDCTGVDMSKYILRYIKESL